MLRKREPRIVVTFHTTADALKTEQTARKAGLEGRLIPVPRALSAGCGLAWSAPPEAEDGLRALLGEAGIEPQEIAALTI